MSTKAEKKLEKILELERGMKEAAKGLEFEKAAKLRDEIARLKKRELELEL